MVGEGARRDGQGFDANQQVAWQAVVDVCEEFTSADKFLFSLPMWNFGIPYKLKHYIDIIAQPGQTFAFDPATGYSGLVTGKPVAVVYARGGAYSSDATPMRARARITSQVASRRGPRGSGSSSGSLAQQPWFR